MQIDKFLGSDQNYEILHNYQSVREIEVTRIKIRISNVFDLFTVSDLKALVM